MRRGQPTYALLLAPLCLVFAACGESTGIGGDVGDGSDFEGFWALTIDVTAASGVCSGEELDPPGVVNALITQEGAVITATAMWTDESGSVSLVGGRSGDTISFAGSYDEDSGTTTSAYTLVIGTGTLDGYETWSWTGPGGTCLLGESTVTGLPL